MRNLLGALLLLSLVIYAYAKTEKKQKHHYDEGDTIPLWVNTVGPYANPTETYEFYHLPFCKPAKMIRKSQKIGEVIQGDRAVLSDYNLPFKSM